MRVRWGKPKPLDNTDRDQRMEWAREGRQTAAAVGAAQGDQRAIADPAEGQIEAASEEENSTYVVAPPPGASEVTYASLIGD